MSFTGLVYWSISFLFLLVTSRKLSLVCACLFIFLGAHTTSCHIGETIYWPKNCCPLLSSFLHSWASLFFFSFGVVVFHLIIFLSFTFSTTPRAIRILYFYSQILASLFFYFCPNIWINKPTKLFLL